MNLSLLFFAEVFLTAFVAAIGWALGNWIVARLVSKVGT